MGAFLFPKTTDKLLMKLIVLLGLILLSDSTFARRRVLITAFEPFAGRPSNGSQEVAALMPAMSDPSIDYVTCILPVEYDTASQKAKDCYQGMDPKPDMVISTGEGGCNIQVETRALNLDNTPLEDNAGTMRTGNHIDDMRTPYKFLSLPVTDMVCSVERPERWQQPNTSTWAGFFVCNNTAFHLAHYFKQDEVPYGFIHLPRSDCKTTKTSDTAGTFNTMIRAGISALESRTTPGGRLPCENPVAILNTDISPLLSVARAACEQSYRDNVGNITSTEILRNAGDVAQ